MHRGTALSLGRVAGDELVCAYHGWRYRADGRCVAIPQLEDPSRVPAKARIAAYRCQERYGLVWVAIEEPRWPLPEVPELEDGSWAVVTAGPYRWRCDAARQVENFTDLGHFPWVHPGLLGDPDRPVVPRHEVRTEGHVLHYTIVRPEAANTEPTSRSSATSRPGRPSGAAGTSCTCPTPSSCGSAGAVRAAWSTSSPRSRSTADRCAGYVLIGRNYNLDQPEHVLQEFEDTIFGQDQLVVESQRPEQVPFDLAAELHLKFDAVAVAYRKAMRALGLATSDAIGAEPMLEGSTLPQPATRSGPSRPEEGNSCPPSPRCLAWTTCGTARWPAWPAAG